MRTRKSQAHVEPLQAALLVETWQSAVDAIASRIGGRKALAVEMWPAKGNKAENWLDDCLNDGRKAKLAPEEIFYILRRGHQLGVHTLMAFIADDTGYTRPNPISVADRRVEAQVAVAHAAGVLEKAVQILNRLEQHN